jgi:hypothetical protein
LAESGRIMLFCVKFAIRFLVEHYAMFFFVISHRTTRYHNKPQIRLCYIKIHFNNAIKNYLLYIIYEVMILSYLCHWSFREIVQFISNTISVTRISSANISNFTRNIIIFHFANPRTSYIREVIIFQLTSLFRLKTIISSFKLLHVIRKSKKGISRLSEVF